MSEATACVGRQSQLSMPNAGLVDIAFFIMMVLVVTSPIATDHFPRGVDLVETAGEGNTSRQLAYLAVFCAVTYGTGAYRDLRLFVKGPRALYAVLALCWFSLAWSIEPDVAFRRLVLTTMIVFSLILTVRHLGAEKIFSQVRFILAAMCIVNFLVVFLAPQIGIHQHEVFRDAALVGNWRGVFPEKNYTGLVCAVTILMFIFDSKNNRFWFRAFIVLASAFFLWKTESKTSIGLTAVAIAAGFVFRKYDPRYWAITFILAASGALALLAYCVTNWDQILAPLNQEDTFTGRSQIWRVLITYIGDNPLLGAGYGSFWNSGKSSPVFAQVRSDSWITTLGNGHNGYLDVATQIGLPGLMLTFCAFFIQPIASLLANPVFQVRNASLYFAILVFGFGHNCTESTILDRDNLLQVMLTAVICMIYLDRVAANRAASSQQGDAHERMSVQTLDDAVTH